MSPPRVCPTCHGPLDADAQFCPYDGTPLAPASKLASTDPWIGATVDGRYRLIAAIGYGGHASVYRAESLALGEDVALKMLRPELTRDPAMLVRFAREARAASRVAHENVVRVLDFGLSSAQGIYFLAMEMLDGSSLHRVISDGPVAVPRALAILTKIATGLARAHELGVVHRDLKPSNVMISPGDRVKIVDFGLSRLSAGGGPAVTRTGDIVGTPEYMAPEQFTSKDLDHRVDVYAFGALAFHLLSGRTPFSGDLPVQMLGHLEREIPDVRSHRAETPQAIAELVSRCLDKSPATRLPALGPAIEVLRHVSQKVATEGGSTIAAPGEALTATDPVSLVGLDDARAIADEMTRLRRLRDRRITELTAAIHGARAPADVLATQREIARRERDLEARAEALSLADAQLRDAEERARAGEADLRLSLVEASLRRAGMLDNGEPSLPPIPIESAERALASFRQARVSELARLRHGLIAMLSELSALEADLAPLYASLADKVLSAAAKRPDLRAHVDAFGQIDLALSSLQARLETVGKRQGY